MKKGDILARIETSPSEIRLQGERISAQASLISANQNLVDLKRITEDSLMAVYEGALNTLKSSNLRLENTFNVVDLIQKTHFVISDQEGIRVRKNRDRIKGALNRAENYLDIAKINPTEENIDIALSKMREALEITSESLTFIQDINRGARYRYIVSPANKVALDVERGNIITALTGIVGSQQVISSIKIGNEARINTAKASIISIENLLISIQEQLAVIETEILSPIDGKVVTIDKKAGEIFMPGAIPFISLVPTTPFQMEVVIHEEDITLIEVGDPVEIEIFAFPDQIFKGRVVSIKPTFDPAKKAAKRMVFYQVIIDFTEEPDGLSDRISERLKLGMTGDVVIITDLRQDVLIIPEDAIFEEEGIKMVQVLEDGLIKNREVKIGLIGDDDMVEILFGLNEGEEVIKNPADF